MSSKKLGRLPVGSWWSLGYFAIGIVLVVGSRWVIDGSPEWGWAMLVVGGLIVCTDRIAVFRQRLDDRPEEDRVDGFL